MKRTMLDVHRDICGARCPATAPNNGLAAEELEKVLAAFPVDILAQRDRLLDILKRLRSDFEGACAYHDGPCDPHGSMAYADAEAAIAACEEEEGS